MKIKTGFAISQASIIISLLVALAGGLFLYQQFKYANKTNQQLMNYKYAFNDFLNLQSEFTLYRSQDISDSLKDVRSTYSLERVSIKQRLEQDSDAILLLEQIQTGVLEFENNLQEQIKLQRRIGFNEDRGLRAFFRQAVHSLQAESNLLNDLELEVLILEIRRREKDYLLRWDSKYLENHAALIKQAQSFVAKKYSKDKHHLLTKLNEYNQGFTQYIYHLEVQGQHAKQGLKGKNMQLNTLLKDRFKSLSMHIKQAQTEAAKKYLKVTFLLILSTTLLSLSTSFLINRRITFSLLEITSFVRKLAKTEDFSKRLELKGNDELAHFSDDLDALLKHFETLLERLSLAQKRLVEDAKMASLGGLVKGFAHELNTPLGVAITSESFLREKVECLKHNFKHGKITKSNLQTLLQEFDDSLVLIESNLNRSADLIASFKKVASHQEYDELVEFDVSEFLHNLLSSLRHEIEKHNATVQLDIPKGMILTSYLGAFSQIFTIFLVNSLRHAKVPSKSLNIDISCKFVSGSLHFRFSDDGVGIKEELLGKVFEPFVTTKRGEGGTGLGLSIVYNLVTQRLDGHIDLQSIENKGVCIYMHFNDISFRQHFE